MFNVLKLIERITRATHLRSNQNVRHGNPKICITELKHELTDE